MTITEIQNNAKTKMEKTKDVLRSDLMAIRAGRADPQLLTASRWITTARRPRSRTWRTSPRKTRILQINPWDAKMVKDISRAIQASDLGLTPSNDGKVIRLMLPELTERRKELTKLVRTEYQEKRWPSARSAATRSIQVKKLKKNNEITEDDQKKAEEDIQKLTDAAIRTSTRSTRRRKRRSWRSNENAAARASFEAN